MIGDLPDLAFLTLFDATTTAAGWRKTDQQRQDKPQHCRACAPHASAPKKP